MIRLVLPNIFGIVTACVPSFGVAAANIIGKVLPPSVDNSISTLAQLTPFAVTAPNTAAYYVINTSQTITWSVAGTTANGV